MHCSSLLRFVNNFKRVNITDWFPQTRGNRCTTWVAVINLLKGRSLSRTLKGKITRQPITNEPIINYKPITLEIFPNTNFSLTKCHRRTISV